MSRVPVRGRRHNRLYGRAMSRVLVTGGAGTIGSTVAR